MNDLIKKYSESDDIGEYSKKPELWMAIRDCHEVQKFCTEAQNARVFDKYS